MSKNRGDTTEADLSDNDLQVRLEFAEPMLDDPLSPVSAKQIAEILEINVRWVYRKIDSIGIEPEKPGIGTNTETASLYPAFTVPLLRDERAWAERLQELPNELTVEDIAQEIGRSWTWTDNALDELGLRHVKTVSHSRNPSKIYSKTALKKVRDKSRQFPLDGGWLNLRQLAETTALDREWIEARLTEHGVTPELRRSSLTGKLYLHYPSSAIQIIEAADSSRAPLAPKDWHTAESIPQIVGRSYNWCTARLEMFTDQAKAFRDVQNVERHFYPPSVIESLVEEARQIAQFPEAGDHLTFSTVVKALGRSALWTRNRLAMLEVETEDRLDGKGRVRAHYPPGVVDRIQELPDDLRTSKD